MSINLDGLEDVIEILDSLTDTTNLEDGLAKASALVERTAKQKAPKGTGELRRSITSKVEGLEGIVYTPLLYAPYVEYGTGLFAENGGRKDVPWNYKDDKGEWHTTSGMPPSPYMRPALNENREEIKRVIKESLLK
ncbi:MAG: HK97 gp10 family phage protein [Clostridia bacterium]|nr:HK97 gp10 family phage protein [Clostridia bacterium]